MGKFVDITGLRFGRLVALERAEQVLYPCGKHITKWLCRCDCGNLIKVNLCALSTGNTKSCGCLQPERCSETHKTHGKSKTRLYIVWKQMCKRCNNPNSTVYKHYGERGIRVCEEWRKSYPAFEEWALSNGYDENAPRGKYTIDRIDCDGDYSPSNCRFITIQEQQQNKRSTTRKDSKVCEGI